MYSGKYSLLRNLTRVSPMYLWHLWLKITSEGKPWITDIINTLRHVYLTVFQIFTIVVFPPIFHTIRASIIDATYSEQLTSLNRDNVQTNSVAVLYLVLLLVSFRTVRHFCLTPVVSHLADAQWDTTVFDKRKHFSSLDTALITGHQNVVVSNVLLSYIQIPFLNRTIFFLQ